MGREEGFANSEALILQRQKESLTKRNPFCLFLFE